MNAWVDRLIIIASCVIIIGFVGAIADVSSGNGLIGRGTVLLWLSYGLVNTCSLFTIYLFTLFRSTGGPSDTGGWRGTKRSKP